MGNYLILISMKSPKHISFREQSCKETGFSSLFIFQFYSPINRGNLTFSTILGGKLWNHTLIKNNKGGDEMFFK